MISEAVGRGSRGQGLCFGSAHLSPLIQTHSRIHCKGFVCFAFESIYSTSVSQGLFGGICIFGQYGCDHISVPKYLL